MDKIIIVKKRDRYFFRKLKRYASYGINMTSMTTPAPYKVNHSGCYANNEAYKGYHAFSAKDYPIASGTADGTFWLGLEGYDKGWLKFDFGDNTHPVGKIVVDTIRKRYPNAGEARCMPLEIAISVSDDDVEYSPIGVLSATASWITMELELRKEIKKRYYKFDCSKPLSRDASGRIFIAAIDYIDFQYVSN